MNIKNLLQLLTEDRSIDYINKTLEDKVPASVISALSSKMKKGRYDDEAMAIFKTLQDWSRAVQPKVKENIAYLVAHAGMIHSILKRMKVGKSDWNPKDTIEDFFITDDKPSVYWNKKYTEATTPQTKPSKKEADYNTPGLKTARVKELKDCYAIFPKNYKMASDGTLYNGLDIERSREDLRKLSSEIAEKDTSGQEGAKVNHWCVAASNNYYYKHYKNRTNDNGVFIIFVEKNQDGSPDWNNRYLVFFNPTKEKRHDNQIEAFELADKFDNHKNISDLPQGAVNLIRSVAHKRKKKLNPVNEIKYRLSKAGEADKREIEFPSDATEHDKLYDQAISFLRDELKKSKIYQGKTIQSYLKRELKERKENSYKDLISKKMSENSYYGYGSDYYAFWTKTGGARASIDKADNKYHFRLNSVYYFTVNDKNELADVLDKAVKDPKSTEKIISDNLEKISREKKYRAIKSVKLSKPNSELYKAVGGNDKILKIYDKQSKDNDNPDEVNVVIPDTTSLKRNAYTRVMIWYDNDGVPVMKIFRPNDWSYMNVEIKLTDAEALERAKRLFLKKRAEGEERN